jgi:hypothetical protein
MRMNVGNLQWHLALNQQKRPVMAVCQAGDLRKESAIDQLDQDAVVDQVVASLQPVHLNRERSALADELQQ